MENTQDRSRVPISKGNQEKILERQKYKCNNNDCKHRFRPYGRFHPSFDHIKPVASDGKTTLKNVQALCLDCHFEKTRDDRAKIAIQKKRKEKGSSFTNFGKDMLKPVKFGT